MTEILKPNDVLQGVNDTYIIVNHVASGGMGAVYRVRRANDNTTLALKQMRPPANLPEDEITENRRLFKEETKLLSSLNHPNVPTVADDFEHDGRPVIVMEFIDGRTLEDVLHDDKVQMNEVQVIGYGIQLCRVLDYLHNQTPPIIYRDLKPPNVMITSNGILKLIDFGVARTHKEHKKQDTIAMGSAGYAPPEQYGKAQTDARSDIYALGATLYHLTTRMPPVPFQPPKPGDIRKFMPSMKARTEKVIIKAMSLKRESRYASCADMEQALMNCLDRPYVDPTQHDEAAAATNQHAAPHGGSAPRPPSEPLPPSTPLADTGTGVSCAHCGRSNKLGARFCAGCGMPLGEQPRARLVIRSSRRTWELKLEQQPVRIGRRDPKNQHRPELDLAEDDRGIASRNHATIQFQNDVYTLTDLGSTNGTMINGVKIAPYNPHRLQQGDRIKIGEVDMEFHWL